jgi:hypothetical protein
MAATIEMTCGACQHQHTFFLPNANVFDGTTPYEYTCPNMHQSAWIVVGDRQNNPNAQLRPRGSIIVKQVAK